MFKALRKFQTEIEYISQKAENSRQGVAYHSTDIREAQKPKTRAT